MTSPAATAPPQRPPEPTRRSARAPLLALVLLALVAAVCAALGRWQLSRAAERDAIAQAIAAGRTLPPLALASATAPADLQPWRAARASGHWRNDLTVLLENRNLHGHPGFWVATPLQQADGAAILVLRGWLARSLGQPRGQAQGQPQDAAIELPAGAAGDQTVTGELATHVPRLYELPSLRGPGNRSVLPPGWPDGTVPRVQNLPLAALAQATGLTFLPVVLMQTSASDDTLVRDWPTPSTNADQNRGYALQWFVFATIAATAWGVVLVRTLRRRRARTI